MIVPMIRYFTVVIADFGLRIANCKTRNPQSAFRNSKFSIRRLFRLQLRTGRHLPVVVASDPLLDGAVETPSCAGQDCREEGRAHELPLPKCA
jgi:hypothetical protein